MVSFNLVLSEATRWIMLKDEQLIRYLSPLVYEMWTEVSSGQVEKHTLAKMTTSVIEIGTSTNDEVHHKLPVIIHLVCNLTVVEIFHPFNDCKYLEWSGR